MSIKPSDLIKSQYPNSILITDRNYVPMYLKGASGDVVLSINDRGEIIWRDVDDLGISANVTSSGGATAATTVEINAQTDNTKMATPSNLKGSRYDVATKLYLFYNY